VAGKLAYTELNKALRDGMDGASKPARRKLRTAEERAAQAILAAELPPYVAPADPYTQAVAALSDRAAFARRSVAGPSTRSSPSR
jgi:hypothetical protein